MGETKQPADPPEMTFKAMGLGLVLALVFGAANAYLGMKAGQTIAATIPAAVIAIAGLMAYSLCKYQNRGQKPCPK